MKYILPFPILLMLCACNYSNEMPPSYMDSLGGDSLRSSYVYDSLRSNIEKDITEKIAFDTAGLYQSPVTILSAKPYSEEYSNYKGVALKWKNKTDKDIQAIRFRWYGLNAFNEPADMSNIQEGIGAGFTDNILRKGKTASGRWNILSRDLKKIQIAYATEVVFTDGTKWTLK